MVYAFSINFIIHILRSMLNYITSNSKNKRLNVIRATIYVTFNNVGFFQFKRLPFGLKNAGTFSDYLNHNTHINTP